MKKVKYINLYLCENGNRIYDIVPPVVYDYSFDIR